MLSSLFESSKAGALSPKLSRQPDSWSESYVATRTQLHAVVRNKLSSSRLSGENPASVESEVTTGCQHQLWMAAVALVQSNYAQDIA